MQGLSLMTTFGYCIKHDAVSVDTCGLQDECIIFELKIIFVNDQITNLRKYCDSLTEYSRRKTRVVNIGDVPMGGDNPIRIQSMTTIDTMDTKGSVEQTIRMIKAGCEYVRITAPSIKEAQNLQEIKNELRRQGYKTPLIADIHFTPNAAELAESGQLC